MQTWKTERRSHCVSCGDRLSTRTPSGRILWRASNVDDRGIVCIPCTSRTAGGRARRPMRQ